MSPDLSVHESHSAAWWNDFWRDPTQHFGTPRQALIDTVLAYTADQNPSHPLTLIDVGSGNGRYAVPFAQLGFLTTAIEKSVAGCDIIRKRSGQADANVQVVRADILGLRTATDPALQHGFDVTFSSGLLEEIPKEQQALAVDRLKNLVKKGGLLVLKYCLEIDGRGVTIEEGSVPPLFTEDGAWHVQSIETDPSIRASLAPIDFENKIRAETIVATRTR